MYVISSLFVWYVKSGKLSLLQIFNQTFHNMVNFCPNWEATDEWIPWRFNLSDQPADHMRRYWPWVYRFFTGYKLLHNIQQ